MTLYVARTMFTPARHSTSECRLLARQIREKDGRLHVEVRTPQIALVTEVKAADAFAAIATACTRFGLAYPLINSAHVRARRKDQ